MQQHHDGHDCHIFHLRRFHYMSRYLQSRLDYIIMNITGNTFHILMHQYLDNTGYMPLFVLIILEFRL